MLNLLSMVVQLLHFLHIFTDFLLIIDSSTVGDVAADGRTASTFFTDFLLINSLLLMLQYLNIFTDF